MPANKLALLRYKTIDRCLQNRFRKWTLDDLQEAVATALYEYEGITTGVSKRTIQMDIQNIILPQTFKISNNPFRCNTTTTFLKQ